MAALTKMEAISDLQKSVNQIAALKQKSHSSPEFEKWRRATEYRITRIFGEQTSHIGQFRFVFIQIGILLGQERQDRYLQQLDAARSLLQSLIEEVTETWEDKASVSLQAENIEVSGRTVTDLCVFIGHGRSHLWARLQLFLEKELGLKTVSYESESRAGESIVPILEQMLSEANFAVLILTAEDETASGAKRARQNVIHEAGLFQGRLGFKKAILLKQDGVEDFSNVAGLQHIPFSGDRIDQTFWELQRVLKKQGLIQ